MGARRARILSATLVTLLMVLSSLGLLSLVGGAHASPLGATVGASVSVAPASPASPTTALRAGPLGGSVSSPITSPAAYSRSSGTDGSEPLGISEAQSLITAGKVAPSSVFFPHLPSAGTPLAGSPKPTALSFPTSFGLADLGVGASGRYEYNTSSFASALTLNNFQDYNPGYSYFFTSPDWMAFQLNTVETNVSYPGSTTGQFWTQNVAHFNGTTLQLENNIWNFSSTTAVLKPGTLHTWLGNAPSATQPFYYIYGPTFTVTYPFTLTLYNNATIWTSGGNKYPGIYFNWSLDNVSGHHHGSYDFVTFNGPASLSAPPQFQVNGKSYNPLGYLWDDAEFTIGGDGGGANANIVSLNGTAKLLYKTGGGTYANVRSAYDYGEATGESSIGAAPTYQGSTEILHQGPSMFFGLWNTTNLTGFGPHAMPGAISVTETSPGGYGFFFMTNKTAYGQSTAVPNHGFWNASYAPSNVVGTMSTWLPPSYTGNPYILLFYQNGYDPLNVSISGNTSGAITPTADSSVFDTPVYLETDAQVASFGASGITGVTYNAVAHTLWINKTSSTIVPAFTRLNDFRFPTFMLFAALRLNSSVYLNSFVQNPASFHFLTDYMGARIYWKWTEGYYFNFGTGTFNVSNVDIWGNTTLLHAGIPEGLAAVEFYQNTRAAQAYNVTAEEDCFGVNIQNSNAGAVFNLIGAKQGADAINVIQSSHVTASAITSYALDLNNNPSWGAFLFNASFVTINGLTARTAALGAAIIGTVSNLVVTNMVVTTNAVGLLDIPVAGFGSVYSLKNVVVTGATISGNSIGVLASGNTSANNIALNNFVVSGGSLGGFFAPSLTYNTGLTVNNLTSSGGSWGIYVFYTLSITVNNYWSTGSEPGLISDYVEYFNATNVNGSAAAPTSSWTSWSISIPWLLGARGAPTISGTLAVSAVWTTTSFDVFLQKVSAKNLGFGLLDNQSLIGGIPTPSFNYTVAFMSAWNNAQGVILEGTVAEIFQSFISGGAVGVTFESEFEVALVATTIEDASGYGLYIDATNTSIVEANNFVANNGASASGTYSGSHIQVGLGSGNSNNTFDYMGFGNYWSDWPGSGSYTIGSGASDTAPLAVFLFNWLKFVEVGLPAGTRWGFTVDSYAPYSAAVAVVFIPSYDLNNGSHGFVVNPPAGYVPTPPSGTVTYSQAVNQTVTINFVSVPYTVTFNETGLPGGSTWSVTLNGTLRSGSGASIAFPPMVDGSYVYTITPVNGYTATPSSGSVNVNGANLSVNIAFSPFLYTATFSEQNLPSGTTWSVTVGGNQQNSSLPIDVFHVANGSYSYTVGTVPGYTATPSSGTLTVSGSATNTSIAFHTLPPHQYAVTFAETGLLSGQNWSVIFNGTTHYSTGTTIGFTAPNGTYGYTIVTVKNYTSNPVSSSVQIAGGPANVNVAFTAVPPGEYTITFTETGLPTGTSWSVAINGGTPLSSSTSTIVFTEKNGNYAYTLGAVLDYTPTVSSGNVALSGADQTVAVSFSLNSPTGSSNSGLSTLDWIIIGAVIAVIVVGLGVALAMRGRRGSAPPAAPQPWSEGTTPAEGTETPDAGQEPPAQ